MDRKIFEPIKEQLFLILEYIHILEMKDSESQANEIWLLSELIKNRSRDCQIYLHYKVLNSEIKSDRNY
jgi:hypothetical protein